jgi:hypothetical protein
LAGQLLLLALYAALYPTLLAAVVILLAQARPRRLLRVYLIGGMSVSIGAVLVVVFMLSGSGLLEHGESSGLSWKGDLTIGGLALLAAVALALRADDRLRERRRRRKGPKPESEEKHEEPWPRRIPAHGSMPIVFGAALVHRMHTWAARHGRQVAIGVCIVFGALPIVRGLVNA